MKSATMNWLWMPQAAPYDRAPWRPLRFFAGYRLLVAGLFAAMTLWLELPPPLGTLDSELFQSTAFVYALCSVGFVVATFSKRPTLSTQVTVAVFVDIAALCLLMYTSGGLRTGFGLLLPVAVAGAAALTPGRVAYAFPAVATVAMLAEQLVMNRLAPWIGVQPVYCAIMGTTLFISTLLAQTAARRVQVTEQLVRDREFDLASLAKLNEHIVGRMRAGVIAVDEDANVRLVNRSAQQLLGINQSMSGLPLAATVPGLSVLSDRWRRERNWSTATIEPSGTGLRVQASFAALGPGAAQGFLMFFEDASLLHEQAQQLKLASLGRMAASIAHEIRNPLSAVTHANQLLDESTAMDDPERRLLRIIGTNARRMDEIIENVMQISRGRSAAPERLALSAWLDDFVAEFRGQRKQDSGRIEVSVSPLDMEVRFDPGQLRQVLGNLCENAWLMASPRPLVSLRAGIDTATRRPYLEVSDNGPGIAGADRDSVFEPFFTTRSEGTGLGLYIARELCAGNRASINLMPSEAGSRFRIIFSDPRQLGSAPDGEVLERVAQTEIKESAA